MDDSSPETQVGEQRQAAELPAGDVGAITAELRRSTAELAERLDAVAQQLDGLGPLREQVQQLAARVDAIDVPSADTVATAVSGQVGDRIVDALAPRVADVVLTRVAAVLVDQLATSVANSVQYGVGENVRAATVESERRISAHVDEAVLALAEALLRRRRSGRGAPAGAPVAADLPAVAPPSPAQTGSAADEPVVPGVAELSAVPSVGLDPTDAQAEAELEGRDMLAQDGGTDAVPQAGHAQAEAELEGRDVLAQDGGVDAVPQAGLDPTDAQAEAELEGRDVLAQDAAGHDHPDGAPDAERPGALALRSGLRGLGLDVRDPDPAVPGAARPAEAREPPRAGDVPTTDEATGEATGGAGRRRPWWRPGG